MLGMDATALVTAVLATASPAPPDGVPAAHPAPQPAAEAAKPAAPRGPARTVMGSIRVAHRSGAISWADRVRYEEDLVEAKGAARRLPADRAREISGVLVTARRIARAGRLNAERLEPVMKGVSATTHQMRFLPRPKAGARLQTRGDGLVYEYRPGSGVQPHPLASAGRVNALALDCLHAKRPGKCDEGALEQAAAALRTLGVRDGPALRFEYTFRFGTGAPLWTSAMAQATAAQALARAGRVTGRREDARAGTAAFRAIGQLRMYSFKPSMRVLNGELQMLIGIADYARISGSREARRLVRRAAPDLVRAMDLWDTGAWTLYDVGGREATLHYHRLAAGFAREACKRALARGICPAARRITRYTWQPPKLSLRVTRVTRAGRRVVVRLRSSKSADGVLVVRGPRGRVWRRAVSLGRAEVALPFRAWAPGRFRVSVSAVAVNGKRGGARAAVKAKPKPRPKPTRKTRAKPKAKAKPRAKAKVKAKARARKAEPAPAPPDGPVESPPGG